MIMNIEFIFYAIIGMSTLLLSILGLIFAWLLKIDDRIYNVTISGVTKQDLAKIQEDVDKLRDQIMLLNQLKGE